MNMAFLSVLCGVLAAAAAVLGMKLYQARIQLEQAKENEMHAWSIARRNAAEAASSMRTAQYIRAVAQQARAHEKAMQDYYRSMEEKKGECSDEEFAG